jgi:hypothetical protein
MRDLIAGAVLTAAALTTVDAAAYVRATTSQTKKPLRWPLSCVRITADSRAGTTVNVDGINQSLARAVANWNDVIKSCSHIDLAAIPASGPRAFGSDAQPVVVFRNKPGQRSPKPDLDPGVIALTTSFYVPRVGDMGLANDGEVTDADIEMNEINFSFADPVFLEGALTHELGHVLGFDHTCWNPSAFPPDDWRHAEAPPDGNGQPAVSCDDPNPPDDVRSSIMYPMYDPTHHVPTADDIKGVCDVYPVSEAHEPCYSTVKGGCSFAAAAPTSARGLMATIALVLAASLLRTVPGRGSPSRTCPPPTPVRPASSGCRRALRAQGACRLRRRRARAVA